MEYDVTFDSANSEHYAKRITVYVVEPERIGADTGLLHFAHGWGGNRFQYRDMQREFAARYDLVCIATEYRQSGYDFDATVGQGATSPYDASHWQVLDCLNAVRTVLGLLPGLNRRRLLAFGGSQGGHITGLMTVFCPQTFALAIIGSGIAWLDAERQRWAGRDFSEDERAIRDVVRLAPRIQCPVVLMHGTADATVPWEHTRRLEEALRAAGQTVRARYYEGGGHGLEPVTTRRDATVELADDLLRSARNPAVDDFTAGRRVVIPCATRRFVLDWSRPTRDWTLATWESGPETAG